MPASIDLTSLILQGKSEPSQQLTRLAAYETGQSPDRCLALSHFQSCLTAVNSCLSGQCLVNLVH